MRAVQHRIGARGIAGRASAGAVTAAPTRIGRLRALARRRRRSAWLLLLLTPLGVLAVDFWRRGGRIVAFESQYRGTYALAALESFVLWTTLLYAASRRRGARSGAR